MSPAGRGTKAYLAANGLAQVCALLRYTLLARLLGPEQLGLAATLVLTAQFFDSVSDSGADRFLIQDKDGDTPRVQKLVQMVFLGRGLTTAIALAILAVPLANFYNAPALAWGFLVLALYPLVAGALHLDMRRFQREHDFRVEGIGMLAAESASLVVTLAVAFVTRSFMAVAWGLIVRSLVMVIVSHILAKRRYTIGYSREDAKRLAKFGVPLMFNGLILFFGGQGDRILVGRGLGLGALGEYSAVMLLIFYPSAMLMRYMAAIHLPKIAAGRDNPAWRDQAVDALAGQTLLLSVAMAAGFAVVAPVVIVPLFGAKFAQSALIIAVIGILQTSRFVRTWPNTVALAQGQSGALLATNLIRLVGFPIAIGAVALGYGLMGLLLGFTVGELLALAAGVVLANRASGHPLVSGLDRCAIFIAASALIVAWVLALAKPSFVVLALLLVATAATLWWTYRREAKTLAAMNVTVRRLVAGRLIGQGSK